MSGSERIHPATCIDSVHLTVSDLDRAIGFYTERLGFRLHRRDSANARLGAGGPDLLVLGERRDAPRPRGTTGLYHFAVLVPTRFELARALDHLRITRTALTGAADHAVSEALYLSDPDGIGIEIYRDRPRSEWTLEGEGVRMTTEPLDLERVLAELPERAPPWQGFAPGTTIGHVHLHVSTLEPAERFYVEVMGFDRMARFGRSASFVAAGGYHHHVGLNTWQGVGAPPPPEGAIGLRHVVVRLPNAQERERVVARVKAAGIEVRETGDGWMLADPSSNRLLLAAEIV